MAATTPTAVVMVMAGCSVMGRAMRPPREDDAAGNAEFAAEVDHRVVASALDGAIGVEESLERGSDGIFAAVDDGVMDAALLLALQQLFQGRAERAAVAGQRAVGDASAFIDDERCVGQRAVAAMHFAAEFVDEDGEVDLLLLAKQHGGADLVFHASDAAGRSAPG